MSTEREGARSEEERAALVAWGRSQPGVLSAWWGEASNTLWLVTADALWFWDGTREIDGRLTLRKAAQ